MLHIAICDDDETMVSKIKEHTDRYFRTHCVECDIRCYLSSENLHYDLQDEFHFDLLLLDIEMPEIDGMDLAKDIHRDMPDAKIIFITSHLEYAITAYEFSVFRYIPKTMLDEKLPLALRDYYQLYCLERSEFYTIERKNHVEHLNYRDILYILKDRKYAIFHLRSSKTVSVRKPLSQVFEEINKDYFYFADRGCIINLANVMGLDDKGVLLINEEHLTISKANISNFKSKMLRFWGDCI